jgi:protoporphyrinogen oxidase
LDFLRFPPVTLLGKIRLALTILYCARINDWRRLEKIPVGDWLRRLCGRSTYENIWMPLLLAKLGENYQRVSAVFIWTYIKRMFSARDPSTQREQLGHVAGGYKSVFDRLEERIRAAGGVIHTEVAVNHIAPCASGGLWVEHQGHRQHFDKVIFTSPLNVLRQVAADGLVRLENDGSAQVEYLGVICMVLVTRKPLVPYYIVNIADQRIPFTGIIGMSNLVSTEETAGRSLTFLPKYVHSEDSLLRETDAKLRALFLDGLRLMFPQLEEYEIEAAHINRAVKVQPLQVLNYSRLVPTVVTEHKDFFVLNTSQFASNTLNNNDVIRAVDGFIAHHGTRFGLKTEVAAETPKSAGYYPREAA